MRIVISFLLFIFVQFGFYASDTPHENFKFDTPLLMQDTKKKGGFKPFFPLPQSQIAEDLYISDLELLQKTLEEPNAYAKFLSQIKALVAAEKGKFVVDTKEEDDDFFSQTWSIIVEEISKTFKDISSAIGFRNELPQFLEFFEAEILSKTLDFWEDYVLFFLLSFLIGTTIFLISRKYAILLDLFLNKFQPHIFLMRFLKKTSLVIIHIIPHFITATSILVVGKNIASMVPLENFLKEFLIAWIVIRISALILNQIPLPEKVFKKISLFLKIGLIGYFFIQTIGTLTLPKEVIKFLHQIFGLLITLSIITWVKKNKNLLKDYLYEQDHQNKFSKFQTLFLYNFAEVIYIPLIIFILLIYSASFFGVGKGFQYLILQGAISFSIVFMANFFRIFIKQYLHSNLIVSLKKQWPKSYKDAIAKIVFLENLATWLIYLGAIYLIFILWKIDLTTLFMDDKNNLYPLLKGLSHIFMVVVFSYSSWIWLDLYTENKLSLEEEKSALMEKNITARSKTLIPAIKNVLEFLIITSIVIFILNEFGVDMGPILGGMAIISFTLTFGAQSIVKDIFTGFFMLWENAIAVGDTIEVEGKKGVIENLTIRSIQLRDEEGALHNLPFGEIKFLANLTKDYGYAFMTLRLPYETDLDLVMKLLKDASLELAKRPIFQDLISSPVEISGIESFTDNGMIVQCRIKTDPGKQFDVRAEFYKIIQQKFNTHKVPMPLIQKVVYTQKLPFA